MSLFDSIFINPDVRHRREAAWRELAAERESERREREVRALEQIAANGKQEAERMR